MKETSVEEEPVTVMDNEIADMIESSGPAEVIDLTTGDDDSEPSKNFMKGKFPFF